MRCDITKLPYSPNFISLVTWMKIYFALSLQNNKMTQFVDFVQICERS